MSALRPRTWMFALMLSAPAVLAQTTAPATPGTVRPSSAPSRFSEQEFWQLRDLFVKLRPSILRIEDCPPGNCRVPNVAGTAFPIGNGYVVTAYHLVLGARNLTVRTLDDRRFPAEVAGYDDRAGLALLRVNLPTSVPPLPLAAGKPAVGDPTLLIGNTKNRLLQFKMGRVTALDVKSNRLDFPSGVLELNTQIEGGDGGAPILNIRGEVIGVANYLQTAGGASRRTTAYAVPLSQNDALLADLRRGVKRDAPSTGVALKLDPKLDEVVSRLPAERFVEFSTQFKLDLGNTPGAFFTRVAPGGPAARADLQPLQFDKNGKRTAGDIVTAVNGQRVLNFSDFNAALYRYQPGDTVTLTVLRAGKALEVRVTLVGRSQFGF